MDVFEKKLRLVIENENGRNRAPGFTPLIFHALSDEIKTLRHLRPKLVKNITFSQKNSFQLLKLSLESCFFINKQGDNLC